MERPRCHYCRRLLHPVTSAPRKQPYEEFTAAEKKRLGKIQTRDHVLPGPSGHWTDEPVNIVPACHDCNRVKGHAPYEAFVYWLRHADAAHRHDAQAFGRFCYSLTLSGFKTFLRDGVVPPINAQATLARVARRRKLQTRSAAATPVAVVTVATMQAPYTLRDLKKKR